MDSVPDLTNPNMDVVPLLTNPNMGLVPTPLWAALWYHALGAIYMLKRAWNETSPSKEHTSKVKSSIPRFGVVLLCVVVRTRPAVHHPISMIK